MPASAPPETERLIANILSLGSGEILARVVAFFGTAYVARTLGPTQFGILGFGTALSGYFSLAISAGFNDAGAREIAGRPEGAARIATSVIVVRLGLASLAFAALAGVASVLDKPATVRLVAALMGLTFFSLALDSAWAYKGLERNHRVGLALVLSQVVYVGLVRLFVRGSEGIVVVPVAQFVGEVGGALFLTVPLLRRGWQGVDLGAGLALFRSSGMLAASKVLRTLIFTFDMVLIGLVLGERQVGLYSAAYRICLVLLAVAVALHVSYIAGFTRAALEGPRQVADIAARSVELAAAVGAPLVLGGMIVAGPLLRAVFGEGYGPAAAAFRPLLMSIGFIFLGGVVHNVLLVSNRLRPEMWTMAIAAATNVGLNLLLIRRFGLVGSAWITALSEALVVLLGLVLVRRAGISMTLQPVGRPLVAAAVMAGALLTLGGGRAVGLYIATGFVVYLSALTALRGVPRDAQPFLRMIEARARGARRS